MSAAAAPREQSHAHPEVAAAIEHRDQIKQALDDATTKRDGNTVAIRQLQGDLAERKTQMVESRRAVLMGEADAETVSPADIQEIELDILARQSAEGGLAARVERLKAQLKAAETAVAKAARDSLNSTERAAALADWHAAMGAVGSAGVRLMAVDNLLEKEFASSNGYFPGVHEMFGPAAVVLQSMRGLQWVDDIRPAWLAQHGPWECYNLPGVTEERTRILADLGIEGGR